MSDPSPVPYRSSRWPARLLISTGLFHNIVGLLIEGIRKPLIDAILTGYIGQFKSNAKRLHSFWFFFGGISMILMGRMIDLHLFPKDEPSMVKDRNKEDSSPIARRHSSNDRSERKVPREVGVWLLGIATVGALGLPRSGFYLMGLQGLALLLTE